MTTTTSQSDIGFGEFETELRDTARRFLTEQFPITRLRELVAADHEAVYQRGEPAGWDPDMWTRIVDMGWTAIAVPEGAGGTPVATAGLAGLVEEAGFVYVDNYAATYEAVFQATPHAIKFVMNSAFHYLNAGRYLMAQLVLGAFQLLAPSS